MLMLLILFYKRNIIIYNMIIFSIIIITVPVIGFSETTDGSIPVSIEANGTCTINNAASLSFGSYSGSSNVTANSNVDVTCSLGTTYSACLNQGIGSGASTTNREMTTNTGGTILYYLCQTSGITTGGGTSPNCVQNWGNTQGTDCVVNTSLGSQQTLTIYGLIPSGQTTYFNTASDTVTLTIYY